MYKYSHSYLSTISHEIQYKLIFALWILQVFCRVGLESTNISKKEMAQASTLFPLKLWIGTFCGNKTLTKIYNLPFHFI